MTAYMFNDKPAAVHRAWFRCFTGWLPFVAVVAGLSAGVRSAGRCFAGRCWAWVLLLVCYFWMPAPPPLADDPNRPVNINYVYGLSDAQGAGPGWTRTCILRCIASRCRSAYSLPAHLLLLKLFPSAASFRRQSEPGGRRRMSWRCSSPEPVAGRPPAEPRGPGIPAASRASRTRWTSRSARTWSSSRAASQALRRLSACQIGVNFPGQGGHPTFVQIDLPLQLFAHAALLEQLGPSRTAAAAAIRRPARQADRPVSSG